MNYIMCFICQSPTADDESVLSITTNDGHKIHAHYDCIDALLGLMKQVSTKKHVSELVQPSAPSASQLIGELFLQGWFSELRSLNDVISKLQQRGFHFDKSTVSNALKSCTKRNILSRKGTRGDYRYIQKKPPLARN